MAELFVDPPAFVEKKLKTEKHVFLLRDIRPQLVSHEMVKWRER